MKIEIDSELIGSEEVAASLFNVIAEFRKRSVEVEWNRERENDWLVKVYGNLTKEAREMIEDLCWERV